MRQTRKCTSGVLNTGQSKCPIEMKHIKGAIIVEHGVTLPDELTGDKLAEACHADRPDRLYPIMTFVEYAKDGGTPQVSAVGYGGNQVSAYNARTDTFTLDTYSEQLAAQLSRTMNTKYDAYYWDEHNRVYGIRTSDGKLAGFPMSTIYPDPTPHPTSGDVATLTVNFCHTDAQKSIEDFDYIELDFNPADYAMGLTEVELVETATKGSWKLVEKIGGYDLTAKYGDLIATNATDVLTGATAVTYEAATETLKVTTPSSGTPMLKSPSVLYGKEIKGIEQL